MGANVDRRIEALQTAMGKCEGRADLASADDHVTIAVCRLAVVVGAAALLIATSLEDAADVVRSER